MRHSDTKQDNAAKQFVRKYCRYGYSDEKIMAIVHNTHWNRREEEIFQILKNFGSKYRSHFDSRDRKLRERPKPIELI